MAVVLEAVTLGSSPRKRQHGIEPIQGLDGGFLIDAEHGGNAAEAADTRR